MQEYFSSLAEFCGSRLSGRELFTANFYAEDSDFVRLNRAKIRQAGSVSQRALTLELIEGRRHASGRLGLSGDAELDRAAIGLLVENLRDIRRTLPEDPLLLYAEEVRSTSRCGDNLLTDPTAALADIAKSSEGTDLVGFYAAGSTQHGFANSFGQRNWESRHSFNFDWSLFGNEDKSAKASYAGFEWNTEEFQARATRTAEQLRVLQQPARTVQPGRYRVYLAPSALLEILELLSWGGFGLRAHRTKTTPLIRMIEEGVSLDPGVTICESSAEGIAPGFQEAGFLRPARIELIRAGRYADTLVSPRSATEYGVPTNGANSSEIPLSLDVRSGDLEGERIFEKLGTGIYVSNLWYLNFSDRNACRTTGMTRFATFWVENGVIQAPLNVMRFDETLFQMLGTSLMGLTREREMILDPGTYGHRSSRSARLPGALVEGFTLTL